MSAENETISDIVAEIRSNEGDMYDTTITMFAEEFHELADRLEAVAIRAYNEIDSAVCGIDNASHYDIDDVRKAMDATIGDYYE